jgi:hypothetical protein
VGTVNSLEEVLIDPYPSVAAQQVERYDGLRARAVVVNSGGSCVVRIRPVWSEYVGLVLVAVMYVCTLGLAWAAFWNPFPKWNFIEWSVFIFVSVVAGLLVWAQAGRVTVRELSADGNGLVVRRRFFGVPRNLEIKKGELENVRWYATKDLKGWPWHSFLQVGLPDGKEIMLANELSVMDGRFAEKVMALVTEVTGWKSEVKRIYMEPPDPASGASGP